MQSIRISTSLGASGHSSCYQIEFEDMFAIALAHSEFSASVHMFSTSPCLADFVLVPEPFLTLLCLQMTYVFMRLLLMFTST